MFDLSPATRVYVVTGATDMRKSFKGLKAIVENDVNLDPLSGHLFVFCNRNRNRIKVLFWDRSGLWVCAKRLEQGTFAWPRTADKAAELNPGELAALLHGIDLQQASSRKWFRK